MTAGARKATLPRRYALLTALGALLVGLLLAWLGWREYLMSHEAALAALARSAADQRGRVEQLAAVARDHVETLRMVIEARLADGAPTPSPRGLAAHVFAAADGTVTPTNLLPPPQGEGLRWSGNVIVLPEHFLQRPTGDPEVIAALDLLAVHAAARSTYPQLRASWYLSEKRDLVVVAPWLDAQWLLGPPLDRAAAFERLYQHAAYTQAIPAVNPESLPRWTPVQTDRAGVAPVVRLSAPVHAGSTFYGVVGTNLIVDFLNEFLRGIRRGTEALLLEDQSGQAVADTLGYATGGGIPMVTDRLGFTPPPRGPGAAVIDEIAGRFVIALPVAGTPWRLIAAVPASEISAAAWRRASVYFALLVGLALLLALSQFVLQRQFVQPAMRLVELIRAKVAGQERPFPKLPALWRPHAERVAEAFDAQAALLARVSEAEALKSAVIDAALDAVITADAALRIVSFNAAAERIFGRREEDVVGALVSEVIIPPALRAAHEEGVRRYRRTGLPRMLAERHEMTAMRADGSEFPVELSIHEVKAAGGQFFTAYIRDLTPLREAQAELERQRDRLHQAEKMSALGSLLAGVAHELNNPLTVVVAQATMLEEMAEEPAVRTRAEKIHAAARRCGRIVKSFLAMARQQKPARVAVDLDETVQSALDLAGYGLRSSGVEVTVALTPDLPRIAADPDQLVQVAANLIVNAQQALAEKPEPRRLRIATEAVPGGVRLIVEDNGPGIPPELRERIFEPYFTTKPLGAGTGIGLAVCANIVRAHGGTLALEGGREGGARFVVTLPLGEALGGAPAEAPARARRAAVLVVDDEPDVAVSVAESLAAQGFAVESAGSVAEAEARLAARRYDLVFCDLRMPGGGGAALYRPGLRGRFVLMTGDMVAGPAAAAALDPAAPPPVLEKPFAREDLAEVLARLKEPAAP